MASTHGLDLFPHLSSEQIACLAPLGSEVYLEPGGRLFEEGEPENEFFVILEGEIKVTKKAAGEETLLAIHRPGQFTGALSLLAGTPSIAAAHATTESRLLRIDRAGFQTMLTACPEVARLVLTTMAQRRPEAEALTQQRERMAALGKLSAGLAHELNNPAAAAGRAAGQLREALEGLQGHAFRLGELCLTPDERAYLTRFQKEVCGRARVVRDPLAQSDAEEAVAEWLAAHAVEAAWELAAPLAGAGVDRARLDDLAGHVPAACLPEALNWLSGMLSAACLVADIEESTGRITHLVRAVKDYTYRDEAPRQDVDVRAGLDNTLTILGHKLGGIRVEREYAPDLPRLAAFGSELNQVWTNLLDNAIDALGGKGRITIRTSREDDHVLVEIMDDGPGIPPEIQERVLEPFFTTKGVGQGTGLGLDTAYRIVVARHGGDLRFSSQPGDTRFQVRLPLAGPPPAVSH